MSGILIKLVKSYQFSSPNSTMSPSSPGIKAEVLIIAIG
jgi:hypothetical protein